MLLEEAYCVEMITKHFNKSMIMTEQDKLDFESAKCCNVKYKQNVKEEIVRDHDHFTGKFKGSAHKTCNSRFY